MKYHIVVTWKVLDFLGQFHTYIGPVGGLFFLVFEKTVCNHRLCIIYVCNSNRVKKMIT